MRAGKSIIVWLVAIVLLTSLMNMFGEGSARATAENLAFSDFMKDVEGKRISEVTITGAEISGSYLDGHKFYTYAPEDPTMVETLRNSGVKVTAKPEGSAAGTFWSVLISWFPMILLIGVWVYFMRQASSGNNKAMSFGKSRARLIENTKKVTFADVAGADESKQELEEVIDFLKDPSKFQRLGGKIPKGVLLVGPPGTGKTLLAKAVAGEANVPFFSISGSDFVEMFVGVGASRVRDMFAQAKKNAPCLLFIDEIDAVGRHRGAGLGGVLTPVGIDTLVEESPFCLGRHTVDGKDYLLMKPIHADFALLGAYKCDEYGNCWYKGTMRNFNVVMATAADTVIAECEYIVPVGDIEPENVHTYGMCVNYIVEGDRK